jgi:hypothetical protein
MKVWRRGSSGCHVAETKIHLTAMLLNARYVVAKSSGFAESAPATKTLG